MDQAPQVSIVVPTYNRVDSLRRTLESLADQRGVDGALEVIVVSDGSTDHTMDYLRSDEVPLPVVAVEQPNSGPAAARNRGVASATGEIVVFVDDDVVAAPGLVAAHIERHRTGPADLVVIGPMLTPPGGSSTPWVQYEQDTLYKQYDAMARGEYEATARQFYTANASLPRRLFDGAGGFDTAFRRAEDVELAYRLADRGARFVFAAEAEVVHHATRSFESWVATPYAYGRNDVVFSRDRGQRWLLDSVATEFNDRHRLVRLLTTTCLPRPRLTRLACTSLEVVARCAGLLHLRGVASAALSGLYNLSYYRGAADELAGGPAELLERLAGSTRRLRAGFVLEQTLGHITHTANLRNLITTDHRIEPLFETVAFDLDGFARRFPPLRNWTVRAGLRARRAVHRLRRTGPLDVLFVHTQVPAILIPDVLRRTPTVVSLDATPIQYDELGQHYGHATGGDTTEGLKWKANRACFRRSAAVVTWSEWTKQGLVERYEVPADKITVIPPGVDVERWTAIGAAAAPREPASSMRVLFVGGDFERKGGLVLLRAITRVRAAGHDVALDVVTRDDVPATDGVRVHHGLGPNSTQLIELYHWADVFCLPTLGDCLPMVLSEAGAVGLPLVSTNVGAIGEIVRDGDTGLLVPVGDEEQLAGALTRLATDEPLRRRMGDRAQQLVQAQFDAATNAGLLVELLAQVAGRTGS